MKEGLLPKQREDYNKLYFRENLNIELELKDENEIRNFEAKFEMQQILIFIVFVCGLTVGYMYGQRDVGG